MFSLEALEAINQRAVERARQNLPERDALFEVAPQLEPRDEAPLGSRPLVVVCLLPVLDMAAHADDIPATAATTSSRHSGDQRHAQTESGTAPEPSAL